MKFVLVFTIHFALLCQHCILSQPPTINLVQYALCTNGYIELNEIGVRTLISSQDYPNYVPNESIGSSDCSINIKACPQCKMVVTIDEMILPNCNEPATEQGSCHAGCDHLYFHEPDYPEETTSYVFKRTTNQDDYFENWRYTTLTRNLFIKFCRTTKINADIAFALYVDVLDKSETIYDDRSGVPGEITSPFFPETYNAWAGLDEYRYTLMPYFNGFQGYLYITTTDWNLLYQSYIEIKSGGSTLMRRHSYESRPLVMIENPRWVEVVFYTGRQPTDNIIRGEPEPGFRMEYTFTTERTWDTNNIHECGEYMLNTFGGHFEFYGSECGTDQYVDCVWVLNRMRNEDFDNVELQVTELNTNAFDFTLSVILGPISTGAVDAVYSSQQTSSFDSGRIYSDHVGLYVHLHGRCSRDLVVKATYVTTSSVQREWACDYGFFCNYWGRCISNTLKCDGVDHCGNNKDERLCPASTTPRPCPGEELSCELYGDSYCPSELCDGVDDCIDGSDEQHCSSSEKKSNSEGSSSIMAIIPAIIVPILLAVVISASLMYCMCKRRKRQPPARAMSPHPVVAPPGHVMTPPQPGAYAVSANPRYPWAPPSYDVSQHHVNMGYTRSMSESSMEQPPPYEHLSTANIPTSSHASLNTTQPSTANHRLNMSNQSDVSNMASSLAGAGALRPMSLESIVPQLSPNKRTHSGEISPVNKHNTSAYEVQMENERNLSLEQLSEGNYSEDVCGENISHTPQKKRRSKKRRAKKRLEDDYEMNAQAGTHGVHQPDITPASSNHSYDPYPGNHSNAGYAGYENGAYYLDTDQTHGKESSL